MLIDLLAAFWLALKLFFFFVALLIFLSSLDDFFIDCCYWLRALYRRVVISRRHQPLPLEQLLQPAEQYLAVMVPAWQEAGVIGEMARLAASVFSYRNFHIFVGTYPNDPETQREVDKVAAIFPNLHKVVCLKDGPTNKADCLNNVIDRIFAFEGERGLTFAGFILHDAEDVVHPLELKLFNYLLPRKDLIQLPVLPLERSWRFFTSGHYLDEFAENHGKDMVVREALTGNVPSAGVGTAFSRKAIAYLRQAGEGQVFNLHSLTEDYDIGFRLKQAGMKEIFVRFPIAARPGGRKEYVAVREYFPSSLGRAVRQKSRWIIGIVFQGWRNIGWQGNLAMRYFLYRDRKALVTNPGNLLAYLIVIIVLGDLGLRAIFPTWYRFPPLVENGTPLFFLLIINGCFLLHRAVQRCIFVTDNSGLAQGLLSVPRMIWGNIINFLACFRAITQVVRAKQGRERIAWDKTTHEFPDAAAFGAARRLLGEILLGQGLVTPAQLRQALELQEKTGRKLGEVLVEAKILGEEKVKYALHVQQEERGVESG